MRKIITLPIIGFPEFQTVNQLITSVREKLEQKLAAAYNELEAAKTDEKGKKAHQRIDKIFTAITFLYFLDFIGHENKDDHSWSGDVYYCAKTMRNLEHRPQDKDKRASNVIIRKEKRKLEIEIDDAISDSAFTERLYNSFRTLESTTKLSSFSEGEDKSTTLPPKPQKSNSVFSKHLRAISQSFSLFSLRPPQTDSSHNPGQSYNNG